MEPIIYSITERLHPQFKESAIGKMISQVSPEDIELIPFGTEYAGNFTCRHPTLRDKTEIAKAQTRELSKGGFVSWQLLPQDVVSMEYSFAVLEVLGTEKPEWFNKDKLFTELDKLAAIAVGSAFDEAVELKKKKPSETSNQES